MASNLAVRRGRRRAESAPERATWNPLWVDSDPPAPIPSSRYPAELTNHYDINYTIGDGGFAKVKLARHRLTGTKVAIKMISKATLARKNELFRAANEIASLQLLKHQNIITLFQVLESRSRVFLVMEYAKGGELFDYICAAGRITNESQARTIFRDVVSALAFMHQEGFAHRDLKPENMIFDENKTLKMIDLGLVSMPGEDMTRTSCGSPNYAAPEVIEGRLYHAPTGDLWSLGICLYAMLCGFLPFDDPDMKTLGAKIRKGEYKEPEHLSIEARDLIRGLIQTDPEKRFSMSQVLSHPWVLKDLPVTVRSLDISSTMAKDIDMHVVRILAKHYGQSFDRVLEQVSLDAYDHVTADYHLLCIAKARLQPVTLSALGKGIWNPRMAPRPPADEGVETNSHDLEPRANTPPSRVPAPISSTSAGSATNSGGAVPNVNVESDEESDAFSTHSSRRNSSSNQRQTSGSPRGGRRRGYTTAQGAGVAAQAAANGAGPTLPNGSSGGVGASNSPPSKINSLFRRLNLSSGNKTPRDVPIVAEDYPLVYRTGLEFADLRNALHTIVGSWEGENKLREKGSILHLSALNHRTAFQEMKLSIEILRIGTTDDIGLRIKRVKGDPIAYTRFLRDLIKQLTDIDPRTIPVDTPPAGRL